MVTESYNVRSLSLFAVLVVAIGSMSPDLNGQENLQTDQEGLAPATIEPNSSINSSMNFSRIGDFDSLPERINRRISSDYQRKHWRLLVGLKEENDFTSELELLPYQKDEISKLIDAYEKVSNEINEKKKIAFDKFKPTVVDDEDPAYVQYEKAFEQLDAILKKRVYEICDSIEEVLVEDQVKLIRSRATVYALNVNLPKEVPPIARAFFVAKSLGLPEEKLVEIKKLASKEIGELNKKIVKSERKAIGAILNDYPGQFRGLLMDFYGIGP
jgi:hypothetical protein